MSAERIQSNCRIIWGPGDYDIDIESDDWETYYAVVKRDDGTSFGPPLTMTGVCQSEEHTWRELDRMLDVWARQIQSGQPMTKDKVLKIFGGPKGQSRAILKQYFAEAEKHGRPGSAFDEVLLIRKLCYNLSQLNLPQRSEWKPLRSSNRVFITREIIETGTKERARDHAALATGKMSLFVQAEQSERRIKLRTRATTAHVPTHVPELANTA
ncbi:hypothetical protein TSTA_124730 [Talaromyces stipitatus ATCC 10500]|uniref:Uncharacterized protein n=1 Tax=Talaromyces stipitatus (strain ATCC 10500 / CBS 375.48 / QM 6759 / NRRL 1006) TaxID=441959 RepID=B8MB53_TALSN|nr:uncharacterized protein TSTA_124730 [Talaromyces stipitatus ATCC 10500]EED18754.1 hypothetical protein TSTA_124730 [Talaromyces stipitatus ATCC 10500]